MTVFEHYRLPLQPGESSWASFKCGGGPHSQDFEPSRISAEPALGADIEHNLDKMPYAAGCEAVGEAIRITPVEEMDSMRVDLPA